MREALISCFLNNQIYVMAYDVVDVETKDNWNWFLTLLESDIEEHMSYGKNFIYDHQRVILFYL